MFKALTKSVQWAKLAVFCLVFLVCTAAVWQDTQQYNVTKTATSYTTVVSDYYIGVTSTAAARTISTTAEDQLRGRVMILKDESNAAGTNNITFDPAGSVTVDGASTKVIN